MVTTKTQTGTKVAVAVGALLLLGLAAYGFGFAFNRSNRLITPVRQPAQVSQPGTVQTAIPVSVCNLTPTGSGGGGRCYPACKTDADCAQTGYVSSIDECKTKAVALCGGSSDCVKLVCGDELKVSCVQGFCSRPNLTLSRAECPLQPGAAYQTSGIGAKDSCELSSGKCYKKCASDNDCVIGLAAYNQCAASSDVKALCAKKSGTRTLTTLDETCVQARCGAKPAAVAGSCLKNSANKPTFCALPLPEYTAKNSCLGIVEVGDYKIPVPTLNNVWVGTCKISQKSCGSDTDCAREPTQTAPATSDNVCKTENGKCYKTCSTDNECASGYARYQTCAASSDVAAKCGTKTATGATAINPACLDEVCGKLPTAPAGSCIKPIGNVPARCETALSGVSSEASCNPTTSFLNQKVSTAANVWVAKCAIDGRACRTNADCAPAQPVKPGSGKWIGICPASGQTAGAPGAAPLSVANCSETELSACKPQTAETTPVMPQTNTNTPGSITPAATGCDTSAGKCRRTCNSADDCKIDYQSCLKMIVELCTGADGLDRTCETNETAKCQALLACQKPAGGNLPSYCAGALKADNRDSCAALNGTWYGTCRTDSALECLQDADCVK